MSKSPYCSPESFPFHNYNGLNLPREVLESDLDMTDIFELLENLSDRKFMAAVFDGHTNINDKMYALCKIIRKRKKEKENGFKKKYIAA